MLQLLCALPELPLKFFASFHNTTQLRQNPFGLQL